MIRGRKKIHREGTRKAHMGDGKREGTEQTRMEMSGGSPMSVPPLAHRDVSKVSKYMTIRVYSNATGYC
jgi:hypothetical protein